MLSRRSRSGCSPGRGRSPSDAKFKAFPAAKLSESRVSTISWTRGLLKKAPLSLSSHSTIRTMPSMLRPSSKSSWLALASSALALPDGPASADAPPYFFIRSLRCCAPRSASGSSRLLRAAAAMLTSCSRRDHRSPPCGLTKVRSRSLRRESFSSSSSSCATNGYEPFTSRKSGSTVSARPSRMVIVRTMVLKKGGMRKGRR
mmetsp:Transcript_7141/g.27344  ORF Transcript_7141/g.27344 Transcript_7141/m.27344 type:complete len:202 (-) Transcript_7141:1617-2222(-)